jgi:hypothetical protein
MMKKKKEGRKMKIGDRNLIMMMMMMMMMMMVTNVMN